VLSLDLELHWGARDHTAPTPGVAEDLIASRSMVLRLAELFARRGISATWATVGLLFATTAEEARSFAPASRPGYSRSELDPYTEPIGATEQEDPLHLAGGLVGRLARIRGQEIASHTFSHYYCLERGQDEQDFRADLAAAQRIAAERGIRLRSLVLPRNQWRADFARTVLDSGFECIRGPQPGWPHRPRRGEDTGMAVRATRLAGSYAGPALPTFSWSDIEEPSGLCNIPASAFLRPASPRTRSLQPLQHRRIVAALRQAAGQGRIVHLWWHPQNFVPHADANVEQLNRLLDEFDRLRVTDGMQTLAMAGVADAARADSDAA